MRSLCSLDGCHRSSRAKGWCQVHYMLWYRTGDPLSDRKRPRGTALERFELLVNKEGPVKKHELGPCWIWTGKPDLRGYGRIANDAGTYDMAHRWAYKQFVGPIPEGLVLDHLCVNPPCVNPAHLEPVTHRVNILDRGVTNAAHINAEKTHCIKGHEFSPENTYMVFVTGRGETRLCKICQRERSARYRAGLKVRAA